MVLFKVIVGRMWGTFLQITPYFTYCDFPALYLYPEFYPCPGKQSGELRALK